jgi:hypothetical protein
MKAFILIYRGPTAPPDATHEGWPEWFEAVGDRLVDIGSAMFNGFAVHADGSTSDQTADLSGFSIVAAENRDEALDLIRRHPLLTHDSDYTIEAFEVPRKTPRKDAT